MLQLELQQSCNTCTSEDTVVPAVPKSRTVTPAPMKDVPEEIPMAALSPVANQ